MVTYSEVGVAGEELTQPGSARLPSRGLHQTARTPSPACGTGGAPSALRRGARHSSARRRGSVRGPRRCIRVRWGRRGWRRRPAPSAGLRPEGGETVIIGHMVTYDD